jgi:hypothetical protein
MPAGFCLSDCAEKREQTLVFIAQLRPIRIRDRASCTEHTCCRLGARSGLFIADEALKLRCSGESVVGGGIR